jgi:hypothetical protein
MRRNRSQSLFPTPEPGPPHPVPLPHTTGAREPELPVIPSPLPYKGEGQGEGYPVCRTEVRGQGTARRMCVQMDNLVKKEPDHFGCGGNSRPSFAITAFMSVHTSRLAAGLRSRYAG